MRLHQYFEYFPEKYWNVSGTVCSTLVLAAAASSVPRLGTSAVETPCGCAWQATPTDVPRAEYRPKNPQQTLNVALERVDLRGDVAAPVADNNIVVPVADILPVPAVVAGGILLLWVPDTAVNSNSGVVVVAAAEQNNKIAAAVAAMKLGGSFAAVSAAAGFAAELHSLRDP